MLPHLPDFRRNRAPSLGFVSPSRHKYKSPLNNGRPTPIYVPPSAFLTLSTVSSFMHLVSLFHLATASEIALQGFSPTTSRTGFRQPSPPVVNAPNRSWATSRLQGLDPIADPLRMLEVLSPCCLLDPLMSICFFGAFSLHLGDALTTPPLMTFLADISLWYRRWPSAFQSMLSRSSCLQRVLPVQVFWPAKDVAALREAR